MAGDLIISKQSSAPLKLDSQIRIFLERMLDVTTSSMSKAESPMADGAVAFERIPTIRNQFPFLVSVIVMCSVYYSSVRHVTAT